MDRKKIFLLQATSIEKIIFKSLSFDGVNDYAIIPYLPKSTGFGISFWLKIISAANNDCILDYQDSGPSRGFSLKTNVTAQFKPAWSVHNGTTNTVNGELTTAYGSGWRHVMLSFLPNSARAYLDNVLVLNDGSCAMADPVSSQLIIGARGPSSSANPVIKIAGLMYRDSAFTNDEMNAIYNFEAMPNGASLWTFNDTNKDYNTALAKDLTIVGATYDTDIPTQLV